MYSAKTKNRTKQLTLTALFAAMICIFTGFICHIPFGVNGTYIHVGDALIYLAASLLPAPYAMAAAAIGAGMADLMTAPLWAPATILIKSMLVLPFTSKKEHLINWRNISALFAAYLISTSGYAVAEAFMFGSWASLAPSVISSTIQAGGSTVIYLLLGISLDKLHFKNRM